MVSLFRKMQNKNFCNIFFSSNAQQELLVCDSKTNNFSNNFFSSNAQQDFLVCDSKIFWVSLIQKNHSINYLCVAIKFVWFQYFKRCTIRTFPIISLVQMRNKNDSKILFVSLFRQMRKNFSNNKALRFVLLVKKNEVFLKILRKQLITWNIIL